MGVGLDYKQSGMLVHEDVPRRRPDIAGSIRKGEWISIPCFLLSWMGTSGVAETEYHRQIL